MNFLDVLVVYLLCVYVLYNTSRWLSSTDWQLWCLCHRIRADAQYFIQLRIVLGNFASRRDQCLPSFFLGCKN